MLKFKLGKKCVSTWRNPIITTVFLHSNEQNLYLFMYRNVQSLIVVSTGFTRCQLRCEMMWPVTSSEACDPCVLAIECLSPETKICTAYTSLKKSQNAKQKLHAFTAVSIINIMNIPQFFLSSHDV